MNTKKIQRTQKRKEVEKNIKEANLKLRKLKTETCLSCSLNGVEQQIIETRLLASGITIGMNMLEETDMRGQDRRFRDTPFGKFDRETRAFIGG